MEGRGAKAGSRREQDKVQKGTRQGPEGNESARPKRRARAQVLRAPPHLRRREDGRNNGRAYQQRV
eukprot:6320400-Prymnesium_polylepis.1